MFTAVNEFLPWCVVFTSEVKLILISRLLNSKEVLIPLLTHDRSVLPVEDEGLHGSSGWCSDLCVSVGPGFKISS